MKGFIWLVVVVNLLAHGWGLLVFLAAGRVLFDSAVVIGRDDAFVLMGLEALAGLLTAALAVRLVGWNPYPHATTSAQPTPDAWGGRLPRPSLDNPVTQKRGAFSVGFGRPSRQGPETRRFCSRCKRENLMAAKHCSWCGSSLR